MFLGAPLLSREYEQGTFRFAWTQGTGRIRWCAMKLNVLGGLIVLAAAGIGGLASPGRVGRSARLGAGSYLAASAVRGLARPLTAGWALLAFMARRGWPGR